MAAAAETEVIDRPPEPEPALEGDERMTCRVAVDVGDRKRVV